MIKINCDLCGKTNSAFNRALIENVELTVCTDCSKFGKVIGTIKKEAPQPKKHITQHGKDAPEEKIEVLVEDYPNIIRKRREAMGLTQKDFAFKINEKDSLVHKIETGNFHPSLDMARKLEKILGIKLIEEYSEKKENVKASKREGFTLGDFINVKNRP